ncbi:hypothetical protein A3K64_02110 [Candidatus Micrarchaeota archaeon RBG_16_36_9]|nr:MAG: hypothetical protein A3K64_02110 [Candidatus Micrarchaeota archaeon RBG_16_36_9]
MQKRPEKILAKPKEYIESVGGLNNITALAKYFSSLQEVGPSVNLVYTENKTEFQTHLDKIFKDTEKSREKTICELTGDADFIRDEKRQKLYKDIINNGVEMHFMMDIENWTLKNAELLKSVGAEVSHQVSKEHYHFGVADSKMFSIFREPATPESLKIVSLPQHEDLANYWYISTDQHDAVEYTSDLWKNFRKSATSIDERIKDLSKNRENGKIPSSILN